MIKLLFQQQHYELPLLEGQISASFSLDDDWRNYDYQAEASISLALSLIYSVPIEQAIALYNLGLVSLAECIEGPVVNPEKPPILPLSLDINYTQYDLVKDKSISMETLGLFPDIDALANHRFQQDTLANSTLWFPGFGQRAQINSIAFGDKKNNSLDAFVSGFSEDARGKLDFVIQESQLPFLLMGKIAGYSNEFVGYSLEDRVKEIKDCFKTLYPMEAYTCTEQITDTINKGIAVQFYKK